MSNTPYRPMSADALRARFRESTKARDEIVAVTGPLRAQRDEIVAAMQPLEDKARELHLQIKDIERKHNLFDLCQEIAMITRALKGRTGPVGA